MPALAISDASLPSDSSSLPATVRSSSSRSTLACSSASTGRSCSSARSRPSALCVSARSRIRSTWNATNGRELSTRSRSSSAPALAQQQLGRVGPLGQRHDAQLELAPCRQPLGPQHRLLTGAVGVEAQLEHGHDPLELADLLLGQRGAHDPDGVAEARLMEREHVGVALDEDHPSGAGGCCTGEVDPEQLASLVVDDRRRRC